MKAEVKPDGMIKLIPETDAERYILSRFITTYFDMWTVEYWDDDYGSPKWVMLAPGKREADA